MRCFIEIFNETKETAKTFGGALSDLVSLLVMLANKESNVDVQIEFLAGLHKVHLVYRMMNAGWTGVFI
jgi:hypothetical protein